MAPTFPNVVHHQVFEYFQISWSGSFILSDTQIITYKIHLNIFIDQIGLDLNYRIKLSSDIKFYYKRP